MSLTQEYMNDIRNMETEPPIFKVFLAASDHTEGFDAWVDFRDNDCGISHVACRAGTPELALGNLKLLLQERFVETKDD